MIPKIIHQMWIGPYEPPSQMMQTWKDKHPDFEYILWNEAEIERRQWAFTCQKQIDMCKTYDGKVDIMRWEILFEMGGVFIDADSICIESIDDGTFMTKPAFACFENENIRKDLISNGTVGFIPGHPALKHMIDRIHSGDLDDRIQNYKAWYAVGPVLLTDTLNTGQFKNIAIYPSHTFLPIHFTGLAYEGHKKVYAYQAWSSTNAKNGSLHTLSLPEEMLPSNVTISVVVLIDQTNKDFLLRCLNSIRAQIGRFCIEIVCVADSVDSADIKPLCSSFFKTTRFITMQIYMHDACDEEISRLIGKKKCGNQSPVFISADEIMQPLRLTQNHLSDRPKNR